MAVAAGKSEQGVMEAWLEGEGAGVGTEALLHAATRAGKVEVVRTMLDRRTVAVGLKDEEGDTALHVAARCTSAYSVIFLTRPGVRACKLAMLRSFKQFLYFLYSKIWAHFHFGTFDPKE